MGPLKASLRKHLGTKSQSGSKQQSENPDSTPDHQRTLTGSASHHYTLPYEMQSPFATYSDHPPAFPYNPYHQPGGPYNGESFTSHGPHLGPFHVPPQGPGPTSKLAPPAQASTSYANSFLNEGLNGDLMQYHPMLSPSHGFGSFSHLPSFSPPGAYTSPFTQNIALHPSNSPANAQYDLPPTMVNYGPSNQSTMGAQNDLPYMGKYDPSAAFTDMGPQPNESIMGAHNNLGSTMGYVKYGIPSVQNMVSRPNIHTAVRNSMNDTHNHLTMGIPHTEHTTDVFTDHTKAVTSSSSQTVGPESLQNSIGSKKLKSTSLPGMAPPAWRDELKDKGYSISFLQAVGNPQGLADTPDAPAFPTPPTDGMKKTMPELYDDYGPPHLPPFFSTMSATPVAQVPFTDDYDDLHSYPLSLPKKSHMGVIDLDCAQSLGARDEPEDESDPEVLRKYQDPINELRQFRSQLAFSCVKCSYPLQSPAKVVELTRSWIGADYHKSSILCGSHCDKSSCQIPTCAGCGKRVSDKDTTKSILVSGKYTKVYYCCDKGRLFAIWALACGWTFVDKKPETENTEPQTKKMSSLSPLRRLKRAAASMPSGPSTAGPSGSKNASPATTPGTSPSKSPMATAKGTGYQSGYGIRSFLKSYPKPQFKMQDAKETRVKEGYFRLLTVLLPSYQQTGWLDMETPEFVMHIIARSPLLGAAAELLGNDSIDHISRQFHLYGAVLDFVQTLGSHATLSELVYSERKIFSKGGTLMDVSLPRDNMSSSLQPKMTPKSTSAPLVKLLNRLSGTCKAFLDKSEKRLVRDGSNNEEAEIMQFCQRAVQVSAVMNKDASSTSTRPLSLKEYHRDNAVMEISDARILYDFAFVNDAKKAANQQQPRGRMKRLVTELATLHTSLPEGIFVCHGASRIDALKVLIVGPKGSPYEHGLFEFDLWCPLEYPNATPKMRFKTTGKGKIGFNPNLYADGKVCLSLLGTWNGPSWDPNSSTVLQILVSIQAMIFCANPWYNEPGREMYGENRKESEIFNNSVRSWTLQHAIAPWIEGIKADAQDATKQASDSLSWPWRNLAQFYFKCVGRELLDAHNSALPAIHQMAVEKLRITMGRQKYLE